MTIKERKNLIKSNGGKIFTVLFVKKDDTERIMNCRLGVKKGTKGGELPYDLDSRGHLSVYDLRIKEHRIINLNTLLWVKMFGRKVGVA